MYINFLNVVLGEKPSEFVGDRLCGDLAASAGFSFKIRKLNYLIAINGLLDSVLCSIFKKT
jgi:hypothetical protein